ncbi:MAG: PaaI family thioesterase [Oligoflexia bacterium]|nr:PaaI family thioesterase [Oligoflexia bacterium]
MSKTIWNGEPTTDIIMKMSGNTAVTHLGIEVTEVGPDYLVGTMAVNEKTIQPAGILHGGVSCVLAETLGSIASNLCIDRENEAAVGQSITANHIRPGLPGTTVTGKAQIVHKGKKSHIWEIKLTNEQGKLVCLSNLTMAIIPKPN